MGKLLKFAAIGGALLSAATAGALEDNPAVPSGIAITLQEALVDQLPDGTRVLRLRYVAPALAGSATGFADVEQDFAHLCGLALPKIVSENQDVTKVVVSLSDRETEFGVSNPDATQYFEAFHLENNTCIWEGF
jgi:hypothetical protein